MKRFLLGAGIAAAWLAGAAVVAAETPAAGQRRAPLKVCVSEDNLPYASRAGGGFDLAVATAVAAHGPRSGAWSPATGRLQEIDDSDIPTARLARAACDAIFSVPGPAEASLRGHAELSLGAPYYGAAFELLACRPEVSAALADLRGRTVAIQSQTLAHFAVLAVEAEPRNYFSLEEAMRGLLSGEADHALLWGPGSGWQLKVARAAGLAIREPTFAACGFVSGYAPPAVLSWNLHVATRSERTRLRSAIDTALAELTASGELARLAGQHGIPWRPPFATVHSAEAMADFKRGAGRYGSFVGAQDETNGIRT